MDIGALKRYAVFILVCPVTYFVHITFLILWHIPIIGQGVTLFLNKVLMFEQMGVRVEDHIRSTAKLSFLFSHWRSLKRVWLASVDRCDAQGCRAIDAPVLKLSDDRRSFTKSRLLDFMTSGRPLVLVFGSCS